MRPALGVTKIAVGPSGPPITPILEASLRPKIRLMNICVRGPIKSKGPNICLHIGGQITRKSRKQKTKCFQKSHGFKRFFMRKLLPGGK